MSIPSALSTAADFRLSVRDVHRGRSDVNELKGELKGCRGSAAYITAAVTKTMNGILAFMFANIRISNHIQNRKKKSNNLHQGDKAEEGEYVLKIN